MALKDTRVLCVDIGSDSVKAAEFSQPREGAILLEKYACMENGLGDVSSDNPEAKDKILETIRNLILANGFLAKDVYLAISGQNAFIRFVKVPAMTDDPEKIQRLLEFEAKQNIPFDEQEIAYDSQVICTDTENAQVEAMFAIVKSSDAETYMRCMEGLKKKVRNVEIAATASYNACNFNGVGAAQCEMVLNIGGRSSTLIFMDRGKFFVRTFLTAGHAITQQISKEFNISYEEAEELKIRHGFVGLGGAYEEPESVVASTVSKIIRNVMTRLHGEIIRTINVYRAGGGRKPEKLYLTGGSSVMTYTTHFFSEKLHIPVEYFNPFQVIAVSPSVNKEELASVAHLFSEVVGLSLRNAVVCPVEISLHPPERKAQEEMKKKIPFFYLSCLALLFCVFVIYWNFWKQKSDQEQIRDFILSKNITIKEQAEKVQKANGELSGVMGDYETAAVELIKNRNRWYDIISAIQFNTTLNRGLPKGVWFTSIKGISDLPQSKTDNAANGSFGSLPASSGSNLPAGPEKVNYIEIKGYIIVSKPSIKVYNAAGATSVDEREAVYKELRKYLETCGVFEPFTDNDILRLDRVYDTIGHNIAEFTIEAKLKEPFEK